MNAQVPNATMAVYLDLENIALGALDAHYPTFSIQKVLERLLLKGPGIFTLRAWRIRCRKRTANG